MGCCVSDGTVPRIVCVRVGERHLDHACCQRGVATPSQGRVAQGGGPLAGHHSGTPVGECTPAVESDDRVITDMMMLSVKAMAAMSSH